MAENPVRAAASRITADVHPSSRSRGACPCGGSPSKMWPGRPGSGPEWPSWWTGSTRPLVSPKVGQRTGGLNQSNDQVHSRRPHRYVGRDPQADHDVSSIGNPPKRRSTRHRRSSRPGPGPEKSCECERLRSKGRPTPRHPGTCDCRPHGSAWSISRGRLGGELGGPQDPASVHRSAHRSTRWLGLRTSRQLKKADTRYSQSESCVRCCAWSSPPNVRRDASRVRPNSSTPT
jgi:hypothetical protein